jgi:hypothetical protein
MGTRASSKRRDKNYARMAEVLKIPPGRHDVLKRGIRAPVSKAMENDHAPWPAAENDA